MTNGRDDSAPPRRARRSFGNALSSLHRRTAPSLLRSGTAPVLEPLGAAERRLLEPFNVGDDRNAAGANRAERPAARAAGHQQRRAAGDDRSRRRACRARRIRGCCESMHAVRSRRRSDRRDGTRRSGHRDVPVRRAAADASSTRSRAKSIGTWHDLRAGQAVIECRRRRTALHEDVLLGRSAGVRFSDRDDFCTTCGTLIRKIFRVLDDRFVREVVRGGIEADRRSRA